MWAGEKRMIWGDREKMGRRWNRRRKKFLWVVTFFNNFSPYFSGALLLLFCFFGLFWFIFKSVCQSQFLFAHFQICFYAFVLFLRQNKGPSRHTYIFLMGFIDPTNVDYFILRWRVCYLFFKGFLYKIYFDFIWRRNKRSRTWVANKVFW